MAGNLLAMAQESAKDVHVPLGVTLLFAGVLVTLITALALEEKIHAKKSVIAGFFALVSLFLAGIFHRIPEGDVAVEVLGETLKLPLYIPAIDWNVIAIILGASLFVDVTSKTGLFTWIAIRLTKASGGDSLKLFWYYGVMTVIFSAVLNNVTAMIIVGSLTVVSLEKLGRRDKLLGFLLTQGLLTNIGGLLTLISSVPNIIVGNAAGITFVDFFLKASPYVVVATVATLLLAAKLFGIQKLATYEERSKARELVRGFDENDGIESGFFFWFGAVMTVLFLATIATVPILPVIENLGMGYVALGFAAIMLVRYKAVADRFYKAIDWDLLAFFAGLFVVIHVMEQTHVLHLIGSGLNAIVGLGETLGTGAVLVAASVFSSVTDNIPLSAMLAKILVAEETPTDSPLWWSVVFGSNLGGNLTPIGSASTLVAVTIIDKHNLQMSFGAFVRAALPYAVLQILLATVYVLLFLS